MMRLWRRLGLALSLCAFGLLAFHADHANADHSNPTHHCCPCHSYSAAPNVAAAPIARAQKVERLVCAVEAPAAKPALRTESAPRAPPVA